MRTLATAILTACLACSGGAGNSSPRKGAVTSAASNPPVTTERERPAASSRPAMEASMSNSKATAALSWKMTKSAKTLEITYRIDNHSGQRLYLCSKLLFPGKPNAYRAFEGASVQNIPGRPDTVQIVVGTPPTDANSLVVPPVMFSPVEPGKSFEGSRKLPLPLESYNVMGMTQPLDKKAKQAILIIQSFVGDPPSWRELLGEDGSTYRIPEGFTPQDIVGVPLPLP